jgi:hypothetical protein
MLAVNAKVHVEHSHRRWCDARDLSCLTESLRSNSLEFLADFTGQARNIVITERERYSAALRFSEL